MKNKEYKEHTKKKTPDLCEDGLEHDIIDCPECGYQFCSSCGEGE